MCKLHDSIMHNTVIFTTTNFQSIKQVVFTFTLFKSLKSSMLYYCATLCSLNFIFLGVATTQPYISTPFTCHEKTSHHPFLIHKVQLTFFWKPFCFLPNNRMDFFIYENFQNKYWKLILKTNHEKNIEKLLLKVFSVVVIFIVMANLSLIITTFLKISGHS